MIIGHGGNKEGLARELGCPADEIIDMSSNLNPLGPPERIHKIITENLSAIHSLPEPDARSMALGFARYHDIDPDRVAAGNGTTWFIYTIPAALGAKKALILGPTYSDYRDGCRAGTTRVIHWTGTYEDGFRPDPDAVSGLAETADLVFVCNPNNPTGTLLDRDAIDYLLTRHPNTCFVVDESYLPFVADAEDLSFVAGGPYQNLLVLSSMSKIFRIPGLRTGFLSGPPGLVARVMALYQPWSVNSLAQAVIRDVFDHPEEILPFYKKTRDYIRTEKQVFLEAVKEVPGLDFVEGHTYFVLAKLDGMTSSEFCRAVGQDRLLIRDCGNFHGLSDQFVRFSLKTRDINLRLANQIRQVMGHD